MSDPLDFSGKVVLITGSSRGIGAEMIKVFGKRGAECVVNYVTDPEGKNKADAQSVGRELKDPLIIECDVSKPEQVESMMMDIGMSKGVPQEALQSFIQQIPLGRLGNVNEIVDAALFLASPMASYITGQVLNVNGGFYMG